MSSDSGIARSKGVVLIGVDGAIVDVEVDLADGVVGTSIVGLPDRGVNEAKDRVRAALVNSGHRWPAKRVTISLSPAWIPKAGAVTDLAIALTMMAADQVLPLESIADTVILGELALDGQVRPVRGVLPAVLAAVRAGMQSVVVPAANVEEAGLVEHVRVIGVHSLAHAFAVLSGADDPVIPRSGQESSSGLQSVAHRSGLKVDLNEVQGQPLAKRALEVAAAGGHHLLMMGVPGAGKTMLAERLPTIMPALSRDAAQEITAIHSLDGSLDPLHPLMQCPPFEAPHHTATLAAMVGGGSGRPQPGAVSRAHRGVLFLDEAPEFARSVVDSLREPLESGFVRVARSGFVAHFPARFQLVLAANPCPCGSTDQRGIGCHCTPMQRRRYAHKISGPLLDRIDLVVHTHGVDRAVLLSHTESAESSATVAARVQAAADRMAARLAGTGCDSNATVAGSQLKGSGPLAVPAPALQWLRDQKSAVSGRGIDKVLRVSWTLADLAGRARPTLADVQEAVTLRNDSARIAV
jgi:magnesium chelatase family protein